MLNCRFCWICWQTVLILGKLKHMEKSFSVSLVYSKQNDLRFSHALRSIALYAKNEDEALGAAIRLIEPEFKAEVDDWVLYMKCIVDITTFKTEEQTKQKCAML